MFVLLEDELRALCMLGRYTIPEVPTQQERVIHEVLDQASSLKLRKAKGCREAVYKTGRHLTGQELRSGR